MVLQSRRQMLRFAAAMVAASTTMTSPAANAMPSVSSSTMILSDKITTMDFSLPSSYDDLSEPTASAANVEGMVQEYQRDPVSKSRGGGSGGGGDGGGGGGGVGNFFSKEKKPKESKPKESKPKKEKPVKEEKEARGPKYEIVDMGLPSYSDSTAEKDRGAYAL